MNRIGWGPSIESVCVAPWVIVALRLTTALLVTAVQTVHLFSIYVSGELSFSFLDIGAGFEDLQDVSEQKIETKTHC